jgi:DNA invertase Pin-like site-specific DNA recombinase
MKAEHGPQNATSPIAYSYIRFSSPEQAKGDSLRRQTEAADEWCKRNGVRLDLSTTFHDLGKSAYLGEHRKNPDRYRLAAFLKLVEDGKIPHGSLLLIENLDRLSREDEVPACHLLTGILMAGVRVVQLSPYEMLLTEKSNGWELMRAVMELSRGHGESAIKSDRIGKAWRNKRKNARENGKVLTLRLPAWIELRNGKLAPIPERKTAIRRIFQLSTNGYGCTMIVKKLIEEGVPAFGPSGHWVRGYVHNILADRRVVGEFQPRLLDRTTEGEPIPNYYPAIISEDEWHAARAGAAQRREAPGRIGKHVNVFAGMMEDARGSGSYMAITRTSPTGGGDKSRRNRTLITTASTSGQSPSWSFPYDTFERGILSMLAEIDPQDILNGDSGPDETLVLAGELARVEGKIAELEAELLNGDVATVVKVLRQLEGQKRELVEKLAKARQKAAHSLSEVWGEAQSLLTTLENAPDPDDARMRLRSVLQRMVSSIWVLVVPRVLDRLCAVQIWFAEEKRCRDYLIFHRPPRSNTVLRGKGEWWARSLATVAKPGELDLRRRKDALVLERALRQIDLAALPE